MKSEKAKPEKELKKILEEKEQSLFFMCPNCGYVYEDLKNKQLPLRCIHCNFCLLCGS